MPFKPLKSRCVRTSTNRVFAYAKTFKWGFAPNPYFFFEKIKIEVKRYGKEKN